MREYLVTVLLAAIITYLLTPLVRDLAIKAGAVTAIRSRDVHLEPTPRWGGLAMWLSMALTLVIVNYLPLVHKSFGSEATGIFLSGTFILFLGLIDDRFDLDPITKFAGQALAGGILLIYGVQILWLPINGITTIPANIGQLLTVLFVMVVINAINFVDGLDGLATGIVAICASCFFAFSYLLAVINGLNRAGAPSLITAVVIGLCLGFLPHNFYPAQIFMGDTGSLGLGGALAALAILSRTELLLVLIGGIFVIVTGSVVIQRVFFKLTKWKTGTGKRVFLMSPLHHHFELKGWAQITVVVRFWIIAGLCVLSGIGLFYIEWIYG